MMCAGHRHGCRGDGLGSHKEAATTTNSGGTHIRQSILNACKSRFGGCASDSPEEAARTGLLNKRMAKRLPAAPKNMHEILMRLFSRGKTFQPASGTRTPPPGLCHAPLHTC